MRFLFAAPLMVLAACGGGSTATDDQPRLDALVDDVMRITALADDLDEAGTVAALPGSGTASYVGFATYTAGLGDFDKDQVQVFALGEMEASIDFAVGTVNAEATNFVGVVNAQEVAEGDGDVDPVFGDALGGTVTVVASDFDSFAESTASTIAISIDDPDAVNLQLDPLTNSALATLYGLDRQILDIGAEANVTFEAGEQGWFEFEAVGERQ